MERRITFGFHIPTQKMISIDRVESGLECNCICPNCDTKMLARKGEKNMHHFAHDDGADCIGAYESVIHKLAKEIFEEEKQICLPDYWLSDNTFKKGKRFQFDEVKIEEKHGDRRPDAVGIKVGRELWIEFANTHFVDDTKKQYIKDNKIACIEIDIRKQEMDMGTLKDFLLNMSHSRVWINNTHLSLKYQDYKMENQLSGYPSEEDIMKISKTLKRRVHKAESYGYGICYKKSIYVFGLEEWIESHKHDDICAKYGVKRLSEIGIISSKESNQKGEIHSIVIDLY